MKFGDDEHVKFNIVDCQTLEFIHLDECLSHFIEAQWTESEMNPNSSTVFPRILKIHKLFKF